MPLGPTGGYAKTRTRYAHHGKPKDIFLFVLDPVFRSHVGLMRLEAKEPEVTVNYSNKVSSPTPFLTQLPPISSPPRHRGTDRVSGLLSRRVPRHSGRRSPEPPGTGVSGRPVQQHRAKERRAAGTGD